MNVWANVPHDRPGLDQTFSLCGSRDIANAVHTSMVIFPDSTSPCTITDAIPWYAPSEVSMTYSLRPISLTGKTYLDITAPTLPCSLHLHSLMLTNNNRTIYSASSEVKTGSAPSTRQLDISNYTLLECGERGRLLLYVHSVFDVRRSDLCYVDACPPVMDALISARRRCEGALEYLRYNDNGQDMEIICSGPESPISIHSLLLAPRSPTVQRLLRYFKAANTHPYSLDLSMYDISAVRIFISYLYRLRTRLATPTRCACSTTSFLEEWCPWRSTG